MGLFTVDTSGQAKVSSTTLFQSLSLTDFWFFYWSRSGQGSQQIFGRSVWTVSTGTLQQLEVPACGPQRQTQEQPSKNILSQVRWSLHGPKIQEWRQRPARRSTDGHKPGRCLLRKQLSTDIFNMERIVMRAATESLFLRTSNRWLQNSRPTRQ